jgi:beta-galactosidase
MAAVLRVFCICVATLVAVNSQTFTIDYDNNQFLKDGEPFQYVSGEVHYFRIPYQLWEDRLQKMYMGGLNTIQMYVPWNLHEPEPGSYTFDGQLDVVSFIEMAQQQGLLVMVRLGPFIASEWEFGGFPYWLQRDNPTIALRTSDSTYLSYVDQYYAQLLPKLAPLIYQNGGPIIGVHVENEYGSYGLEWGCDETYKTHLYDLFRQYLGDDLLFFTTDNMDESKLSCGKIDGAYATVDFGADADVDTAYDVQKEVETTGPFVNSEYYSGWLDNWSGEHHTVDPTWYAEVLDDILSRGGSVSMYMYHGGTNFNFNSGGTGLTTEFLPIITSYDYDAPLSECGDPTDKFYTVRDTISKYMTVPTGTPSTSTKFSGTVTLQSVGTLWDLLSDLTVGGVVTSDSPMSFADLYIPYGYVMYQIAVSESYSNSELSVPNLGDRAYVYVDESLAGILERSGGATSLSVTISSGQNLRLLVENQGRLDWGENDVKGLNSGLTLGGNSLSGTWSQYRIPLNNTAGVGSGSTSCDLPNIFRGEFTTPSGDTNPDTFLDTSGFGKGVAFINGYNLGRYWPTAGPQITLYIPGVYLASSGGTNTLTMIEFEKSSCSGGYVSVDLVETPNIG